jgi:allophanate hydrolase
VPGMTATTSLVVCGAHLRGQPLNAFLLGLGAVFLRSATTAPVYRMYALPPEPGVPARPGLVRQAAGGGSMEVEVYEVPVTALGALLVTVAPPLAIGHVVLADGTEPPGFVCEHHATETAPDITSFGSWRTYLTLTPTPAP